MTRTLKASSGLVLAALVLSACNGDDNGRSSDDRAPQDRVGSTFSTAFAADGTDAPIDPKPGDAGRLSLTDDPIDF